MNEQQVGTSRVEVLAGSVLDVVLDFMRAWISFIEVSVRRISCRRRNRSLCRSWCRSLCRSWCRSSPRAACPYGSKPPTADCDGSHSFAVLCSIKTRSFAAGLLPIPSTPAPSVITLRLITQNRNDDGFSNGGDEITGAVQARLAQLHGAQGHRDGAAGHEQEAHRGHSPVGVLPRPDPRPHRRGHHVLRGRAAPAGPPGEDQGGTGTKNALYTRYNICAPSTCALMTDGWSLFFFLWGGLGNLRLGGWGVGEDFSVICLSCVAFLFARGALAVQHGCVHRYPHLLCSVPCAPPPAHNAPAHDVCSSLLPLPVAGRRFDLGLHFVHHATAVPLACVGSWRSW